MIASANSNWEPMAIEEMWCSSFLTKTKLVKGSNLLQITHELLSSKNR